KVLSHAVAREPRFRARFEDEAHLIAALNHPHICALYDVGQHDGAAFLVMEFLDGDTLADRLEEGPLPCDAALTIAADIADGLGAAHSRGIVHRDLKPGNIVLTSGGAKLVDFGLAQPVAGATALPRTGVPPSPRGITMRGAILGTPQYMAPEQLEGKEADARTDIFALGAVLYEMLTGRKAFDGESPASLAGA